MRSDVVDELASDSALSSVPSSTGAQPATSVLKKGAAQRAKAR